MRNKISSILYHIKLGLGVQKSRTFGVRTILLNMYPKRFLRWERGPDLIAEA